MDDKTIPIPRIPAVLEEGAFVLDQGWDQNLSYRALFDQTGECIFIISLDFHYITANQRALDLLGYAEHELVNKAVNEVVSQEEPRDLGDLEDQTSVLQERILKRKDGSTVPVEISTTIVYGDDQQPAYIQSVARDISIRKNSERLLKRNARILSIISEATARLLQSSDIDAKLPALLESLGRAINVSCCAIFTVESFAKSKTASMRYLWNATSYSDGFITRALEPFIPELVSCDQPIFIPSWRKGRRTYASTLSFISIAMDRAFSAQGYLAFVGDETSLCWSQAELDALQTAANLINAALQRKRYEETIRLNEIRNRLLVDALPDLILRVDVEGKILDYSSNPIHPLYIHRDLAYGRQLDQTFPAEIATQIIGAENGKAFLATHTLQEFHLPYAKGTYEANLYPICAEEALIVIRDVTEQVKLNEMKSDFINRASHELRTPLTSAMLMVDLIQEGGTPEEMEECWRTLNNELRRQKELIDRLLMAGRLESGMIKIEAREIELLPILRESMQSVQTIASLRGISLVMSNGQTAGTILGDRGALQQVFVNLMTNAVKFSPEGSQVEINISQEAANVAVAIVDKGIGIPQEDIPRLFERFYRAKNVTVAEIPGSGIGLYIVNSIVQELGGEITVESVPDQGTTFTVSLHRADAESSQAEPPAFD